MFIARFAQSEEVPVPPFALRKTISEPLFSLYLFAISVEVSAPNDRVRLSSSAGIACADLTRYSSTPAFKDVSLRTGLGSLESATSAVLLVRGSFRNF